MKFRYYATEIDKYASRPPRGGRGLKSPTPLTSINMCLSPPARGAWIEILCPCHVPVRG